MPCTQLTTIIPDLTDKKSWNRFRYVSNNPIKFNDPTGHMEDGACGYMGEKCWDPLPSAGHPRGYYDAYGGVKELQKGGKIHEDIKAGEDSNSNLLDVLDTLGLTADITGTVLSFAGDLGMVAGYVLGEAVTPAPLLDGYIGSEVLDKVYEKSLNPLENMLGGASFLLTTYGEYLSGSTSIDIMPSEGILFSMDLGPDTTLDLISQGLGATPIDFIGRSAIVDTILNVDSVIDDIKE